MGKKLGKGIDDPSAAMTLHLLSWSEKDGYRWGWVKCGVGWDGVGKENGDGSGLG